MSIDCITSHFTYTLFSKKGSKKRKMKWNQYCVRVWLLWPRLSGRLWQMKADGWKNTTLCRLVSFFSLMLGDCSLIYLQLDLLDQGNTALLLYICMLLNMCQADWRRMTGSLFPFWANQGHSTKGIYFFFWFSDLWISKTIFPNI